jgi:uncharacterized repeat protein (TIGR03803 family)
MSHLKMREVKSRTALIAALLLAGWVLPALAQTVIHDFRGPADDGVNPSAGLIADKDGALYGTTAAGGQNNAGAVFRLTQPAAGQKNWTVTLLYSFKGDGARDGSSPLGRLTFDRQGALYGTTNGGSNGAGAVFRLTPPDDGQTDWTETVIYRFKGRTDGSNPTAGLIADKDGALYGTTLFGGAPGKNGHGAVFKLSPPVDGETAWTEAVIYRFRGGSDGANPYASLNAGKDGALYGTTLSGGTAGQIGHGTVFRLTPPAQGEKSWTETVLHRFAGGEGDGDSPLAGLVAGTDGALYGATFLGGSSGNQGAGNGTIFRLTPPEEGQTAWTETILYRFCAKPACADGTIPEGELIADEDGTLYGTTQFGGGACALYPHSGCGTIFRLTPPATAGAAWTETVLYRFAGGRDGVNPFTSLIADRRGSLFGTTPYGGRDDGDGNGYGTVFKLNLCLEQGSGDRRNDDLAGDRAGCPAFLSMQ